MKNILQYQLPTFSIQIYNQYCIFTLKVSVSAINSPYNE